MTISPPNKRNNQLTRYARNLSVAAPIDFSEATAELWKLRDATEADVIGFLIARPSDFRHHLAADGNLRLFRAQEHRLAWACVEIAADSPVEFVQLLVRRALDDAGYSSCFDSLVHRCIPSEAGVRHYTRRLVQMDTVAKAAWSHLKQSQELIAGGLSTFRTPWAISKGSA